MKKSYFWSMAVMVGFVCTAWNARSQTEKWQDLFDGNTLKGWTQQGGKALYKVDGDTIVGSTVKNTPNVIFALTKLTRTSCSNMNLR